MTHWNGVGMAAIVGICFAANSSLAGVAYAGGSNPLTVLLIRAVLAFMTLNLLLRVQRVPRTLPHPRRFRALGIGVLFASYSFGVMAAIEFMPVALVILGFYTYPLMIAGWAWTHGKEPFNGRTALALVVAFIGLVLALDIFGATPDARGIAMAIGAAVILTAVLILNEYVRGDGDSRPVTLHLLGTAAVCYGVAVVFGGHLAFPQTLPGWGGLIGAPIFYTFAVITLFEVLGRIGSVKTSLVMNIEPVASVVFGYLLLNQRLGITQLCGVALVIGALVLVEAVKLKPR